MKVNTDGVLLGAWRQASSNVKHILDIGTGTGVIALMMAQKNEHAIIDAIDIDADAYIQSHENFKQSMWSNRLTPHHTSLQNFESSVPYDLIITNPPYFIDDQKTESYQKNIAKHTVALSYADLLSGISQLLATDGKACIVLPVFNLLLFENIAAQHGMYITLLTEVIAVAGKAPYLVLIQLEHNTAANYSAFAYLKNSIAIQDVTGNFTAEYKLLTKDFYLKF